MKKNFYLKTSYRIYEDSLYNQKIDFMTKFNGLNNYSQPLIKRIILNFGFKHISFEKKKMVLFFLILEMISNQKCIITKSKKNLIIFKIKKGGVAGCKVTLRNIPLFEFLDNLILSLPRLDNFKGFNFNLITEKKNEYSMLLKNLFMFYLTETEIVSFINFLDVNFFFNTKADFEKIFLFFYYKIPLNIKN